MIRTIVVEDEPLARSRIVRMLNADPEIEIVAECKNGIEALEAIRSKTAELLFLDVQMPEMNGIEVLEALGRRDLPHVVFVTAYEQYTLHAFELYALDYLLKPFSEERLMKALNRARQEIQKSKNSDMQKRINSLLNELREKSKYLNRILLKDDDRAWFLKVDDIDWIEAESKYVRIHFKEHSHLLRQPLTQLAECLDPSVFVRIHRSVIVNLNRIREMRTLSNGDYQILLQNGIELPLSRTYRKNIRELGGS